MNIMKSHRAVNPGAFNASSFIIERFKVPEGVSTLLVDIHCKEGRVESLLIYDSSYTMRVDHKRITDSVRITLAAVKEATSHSALAGPIDSGEWFLAMEFNLSEGSQQPEVLIAIDGLKE